MSRLTIQIALMVLLTAGSGAAIACDFTAGQTKFLEYAHCRYGADSIVVVDLPEGSGWEHCLYLQEAFRPDKLLAVTKVRDGKEVLSINDRSAIGNPCYLTKRRCDEALAQSRAEEY